MADPPPTAPVRWISVPRWVLPAAAVVVAAVLTVVVTIEPVLAASGAGVLLYVGFVGAIAVANGYVAWTALNAGRRARVRPWLGGALGAFAALAVLGFAVLWSLGLPELWGPARGPYEWTAAFALVESIVVVAVGSPRRWAYRVAPLYNGFVFAVTTAWYLVSVGSDATGAGGIALHGIVAAQTVVQATNVSFLAFLSPIFLFPPILTVPASWERSVNSPPPVQVRTGLRPWGRRIARAGSFGLSAALIYLTVGLLIWTPSGVLGVSGMDALAPASAGGFARDPLAQFGVVGAALTDIGSPPASANASIAQEVGLARQLGVQYLRYDVQTQLLASPAGRSALAVAAADVHAAGLGLILAPYGDRSWGDEHPSFDTLNETLQNETAWLAEAYRPAWIFPFYEPNGQLEIDLGHSLPASTWAGAIETAATTAKRLDPGVRVLVEVADASGGPALVAAIARLPAVDAVGFDLYPTSAGQISDASEYAAAVHAAGKAFWISETGVDSLIYGETAQARVLAQEVRDAFREWNASGFCVWGLQDNVGEGLGPQLLNGLGLVAFDGREKPAFAAYRSAIAATRLGTPGPT